MGRRVHGMEKSTCRGRCYFWSECRDSLHSDSFGNQNHSVAAVKPSASNCPLDSCIGLFESPFYPIKSRNPLMRIPVSLVGVSGFEPEVSWTRIKSHLFNIVLLRSKSVDFMRILWYHCVVKFCTVVYLLISLFTQVFTFGRQ